MNVYHCNEAVLNLPELYSLVDQTRQCLQIVTESRLELELVIERERATKELAAYVDASVGERMRSLRGFELVSRTDREYPQLFGSEVRVTWVDRERGPRFAHELHALIGSTKIAWIGTCRLATASACDAWMQTMLHHVQLR